MEAWTTIATLITSVTALLTILEMRWQRLSAYKPELLVSGTPLVVRQSNGQYQASTVSSSSSEDDGDNLERGAVECANIGFGPAKQVSFYWEFDFERLIDLIESVKPEGLGHVSIENGCLQSETSGLHAIHRLSAQTHGEVAVVLAGGNVSVDVPKAFLELYAFYVLCLTRAKFDNSATDIPEVGELALTFKYRDLGNYVHSKRFVLKPTFFVITCSPDNSGKQNRSEVSRGMLAVESGATD